MKASRIKRHFLYLPVAVFVFSGSAASYLWHYMQDMENRLHLINYSTIFIVLAVVGSLVLACLTYFVLLTRERAVLILQMNDKLSQFNVELEDRVAKRTRALKRSNEDLETLAFVASHDLQHPLRKIQAFCEVLVEDHSPALPADALSLVSKIQSTALRMDTLVNELLFYARLKNQNELAFADINLHQIINDVLSDLENRIRGSGARISVGDLPIVRVNPTYIKQLFLNLIGNALKFCSTDRVLEIEILSVAVLEGFVHVAVRDNGIGIAQKDLRKVFQLFQRAHGAHEHEGHGIGLSICKKIIDLHGGKITVESQEKNGSTFIVTLPLASSMRTG